MPLVRRALTHRGIPRPDRQCLHRRVRRRARHIAVDHVGAHDLSDEQLRVMPSAGRSRSSRVAQRRCPLRRRPARGTGRDAGHARPGARAGDDEHPGVLFLSRFDNGDRPYDSAAFIDNIRITTPPGTCPTALISLGPAVAITGPTVATTVDTQRRRSRAPRATRRAMRRTVTVRIYNGVFRSVPPSRPSQQRAAATTWSARRQPLAAGQYTAQATQANAQADGVSAPTAFTVPLGAGGGGPAGAARAAGRLRRPRQRRHPRRPGHLRRLAAADPRKDLRRARGLG